MSASKVHRLAIRVLPAVLVVMLLANLPPQHIPARTAALFLSNRKRVIFSSTQ